MREVVATVIATRRSAPRPVGSKLLVTEDGAMSGSVSGGCVESDVYEACRGIMRGDAPRLLTYGISDDQAFQVGLPCGGEIDVFVREYDRELYERIGERRAVVFTDVEDGSQRLVFEGDDARRGRAAARRALEGRRAGGKKRVRGRVRPAAASASSTARSTRRRRCARRRSGSAGGRSSPMRARSSRRRSGCRARTSVIVAWPEEALAQVQPDHATAVVILTHDDKFDLPALVGALATDAFYIGALGSRRNQEKRRERLLEAGVAEDALERIHGPAGLDIGAHSPAETAVSMLSEILAVRASRAGGPLREAKTRIHAEV